jgi:hypothetical protein
VACGDGQPWQPKDFSNLFKDRFEAAAAKVFEPEAWCIELLGFYRIAATRAEDLARSVAKPPLDVHPLVANAMIVMAAVYVQVDELEEKALGQPWPENPPLDRLYYGWCGPGSSENLEVIAGVRKELFDLWLSIMRLNIEARHENTKAVQKVTEGCVNRLFKITGEDEAIWSEWIDTLVNAGNAMVERTSRATVGVQGQ